jgi:hypothetical protein
MRGKGMILIAVVTTLAAWFGANQPQPAPSKVYPVRKISFAEAMDKVHYGFNPWFYKHMQGNEDEIAGYTPNKLPKVSMDEVVWNLWRNNSDVAAEATGIYLKYIIRTRDHKPIWVVTCMDVDFPLHWPPGLYDSPMRRFLKFIGVIRPLPPTRKAVTFFVNADTGKYEGDLHIAAPYK